MSVSISNGAPFPPLGPITRQIIIPSYLYQQYQGDDALQAFVDAENVMAQEWLNWWNLISLPVWSGLTNGLLDWIGAGLYGYPRPTLSIPTVIPLAGPYNSGPYNVAPYNGNESSVVTALQPVSDDIYQRMLTWHLYLGDGWQFTTKWLKKRVHRFLNGPNGTSPSDDNTLDVSVVWSAHQATITIPNNAVGQIFEFAVLDGVLALPLQYTFEVVLGSVVPIGEARAGNIAITTQESVDYLRSGMGH